MARKHIPFALVYDFDGTLAPGNMQERDFIPNIGMKTSAFWADVKAKSAENDADNILIYMHLMLEKAQASHVPVRRADIEAYGRELKLFPGLTPAKSDLGAEPDWFERISTYGRESGIDVQHYIVSSGLREMISGTAIGSKSNTSSHRDSCTTTMASQAGRPSQSTTPQRPSIFFASTRDL